MILLMIASFLVLLALGMPLAFAMGLSAVLALLYDGTVPLNLLPQRFFSSLDSFPLLAIPLYVFAGALMNAGGITASLVDCARALIGHIRGGLGQVNVAASLLFSGISGSAAADASAIGAMLLPAMEREGYRKEYSVVVTATSSIIGPIVPPSILMVIYGAMTGLSIGTLFIAGLVPGLVLAFALMAIVFVLADRMNAPHTPRSRLAVMVRAFLYALPALTMPLLIIGGILSGVFTATEAGIVAVAYGLLFGIVRRELDPAGFYVLVRDAVITTGSVLIILGGASLFSWILAREGVARAAVDLLQALTENPDVAILIILAFLLLLGMLVETVSALILVVPVLAPIGAQFGFDPVHFAVVTVLAVLIGAVTPPVAILLLIACRIGNVEYLATLRPLMPFLATLLVVLLAVSYLPGLVLFLPEWALGYQPRT